MSTDDEVSTISLSVSGAGNGNNGDMQIDISADGSFVSFVYGYDLVGNGPPVTPVPITSVATSVSTPTTYNGSASHSIQRTCTRITTNIAMTAAEPQPTNDARTGARQIRAGTPPAS